MSDLGHKRTDDILEAMERRVSAEYGRASREAQEKLESYLQRFSEQDKKMQERLAAGEISKKDYNDFRVRKIAMGKRWEELRDNMAADFHNSNKIAMSIIRGYMPEVYALNHNYAAYQIESGIKADTYYTLYDRQTVERLMREDKDLLPKARPGSKTAQALAANKDLRWNRQHIQSELLQGLIQGEPVNKIAGRMQNVTDMNHSAAVRNARTMVTGAENAGRVDSYKRAEGMGVELEQEWMATLDRRTRNSHKRMHGERRPVGEQFSNGCEYPGDPAGDPEEIYNCRCSLIAQIKGFETSRVESSPKLEGMTFDEWQREKTPNRSAAPRMRSKSANEKDAAGSAGQYKYPINQGAYTTLANPRDDGRQQDLIRPHSIMRELKKSDVGRLTSEHIEKNGIKIKLYYNIDNPSGAEGYYDPTCREIWVFCDKTKTVHETALTVIHETAHDRFGAKGTRSEEVRCFIEELRHDAIPLTEERIRAIIKSVNNDPFYGKLPWK